MAGLGHKIARGLVVAGAATSLAFLTATSAYAWDDKVNEGFDYATITFHTWTETIEVCDLERDGNGVYAVVRHRTGEDHLGDSNGSQAGCSSRDFEGVTNFAVCEDDWGSDTCVWWR
ncbi:hypothetical protein [Streptomyces sp. 8N616]|uniref:hypothetical protein n=1 Tax=Streptomyces sp. 8N616 TaxID=3457414 RepID=UPI003FD58778